MKIVINLTILIAMVMLSTFSFADEVTNTSSVVTSAGSSVNSNGNANSKTTVINTTSVTKVIDIDAKIVTAIYDKYAKDAALIGTALTVTCKNGVVTIDGTVTAQSQADQAVLSAKAVQGVRDVISAIQVTTNKTTTNQPKPTNY